MGISINGPSGIDTAYIIDSLVAIEHQKVDQVDEKIDSYQSKIDAYSKLEKYLSDFQKNAEALEDEESFNIFKTYSSNEDIATIEAGVGAVEGSYNLKVFQTATREKLISKSGLITDDNAKLSDFGISSGTISINGVEINIDASTDTLQDLRLKINNAKDANGDTPGVTATVLKISDTDYRLVIGAKDTGSAGVEYKDVSGSVLQDLGIILDASGTKGIYKQKFESADDLATAFSSLAIGESITYSGIDNFGNSVSSTFIKKSDSTIDDLLKDISDTFNGMVNVSVDSSTGVISIEDKVGGNSSLDITSMTFGSTSYSFNKTQDGYLEDNVLILGKDAYFSIDNINMNSTDNSVSDRIKGVTLTLKHSDPTENVIINLDRDIDEITKKFDVLIDSFNAVFNYVNQSTQYGNKDEKKEAGVLAGDSTTRSIVSQLRNIFYKTFNVSSSYNTLTMIGLKTDATSGKFEIDKDTFKERLRENFEDVVDLFVTEGYSDNPNITMGRFTDDTQEGDYLLEEVDADHYRISADGGTTWYTSAARVGSIVTFNDGPAKGLSITAPAGSGNGSFTFRKGIVGSIKDLVSKLTDNYDGVIKTRKDGWNSTINRLEDRKLDLEDRVEAYRLRLVNEFANMEKVLNSMKTQSANMFSQLGLQTSSSS